MQSNEINPHRSAATINYINTNGPTLQITPLPILKNLTITPVSKLGQDSSKIHLDKKGLGPALSNSKEHFTSLNLKISKEITITPINGKENNLMSKLNNLPNITLNVVNLKPGFKVPEISKLSPKIINTSQNKSKTILERKVLSEIQNDKINVIDINKNSKLSNNVKNFTKINSSFKKTSICNKRIDSSHKLTEISQSFPKNKSKNLKTIKAAKEILSTFTKMSDKNLTLNKIEHNKTHKLTNKDYMLMDLSSNGQINIVWTTPSHLNLLEHDSFTIGINKSTEEGVFSKVSNSDFTQGSSLLNTLKTDQIQQSTNPNFYFYNDILKQPLLQNINMMNSPTVLKDNQLLQETRSYFCDNLIEKTSEIEDTDITSYDILSSIIYHHDP